METSPSIVRILDVPPYNQFTLSCTVWAEALGEKIPLPLTIDWIKRVQLGSNVRFSPVTPEDPQLSPDPAEGYHSILRASETSSFGSTFTVVEPPLYGMLGELLSFKPAPLS